MPNFVIRDHDDIVRSESRWSDEMQMLIFDISCAPAAPGYEHVSIYRECTVLLA